jgi:hypothetical protein
MTQPTRDPLPHQLLEGIWHEPPPTVLANAGIAVICGKCGNLAPTASHSLLHWLGCFGTWFRSDEGPPLAPEEVETRWRLLFGSGF